jgi:hypothetical protein
MARPESPEEPAYDDETPEHVQRRLADLEKLVLDLVTMLDGAGWPPHREPLQRRASDLLNVD